MARLILKTDDGTNPVELSAGTTVHIGRDPGNEVAARYGLSWTLPEDLRQLYLQFGIDLPTNHGEDSWTLPMPARYVIDTEGVIRYLRTDPDYTRRPEPAETVEVLRSLAG